MKTNSFIIRLGTLSCAALFTTAALADNPAKTTREPERIYNAETRNWEPNPDYHAPKTAPSHNKSTRFTEPQRIYNAITRNWEANPDYHEPVVKKSATPKTFVEPNRIYDAESGQWVQNPDAPHSR